MSEPEVEHPNIVFCPDGPLLLRGDHLIEDADGDVHRTARPVSAVCRCGKSASHPWCDGTHKLIPRERAD
jgi:CDGSH-type Zn-finger protein